MAQALSEGAETIDSPKANSLMLAVRLAMFENVATILSIFSWGATDRGAEGKQHQSLVDYSLVLLIYERASAECQYVRCDIAAPHRSTRFKLAFDSSGCGNRG